MLDLSHMIQDMTNTEINTTAAEFKMITDKKDEPDYKAVSKFVGGMVEVCLLYTSPSPRDRQKSRMPSSA